MQVQEAIRTRRSIRRFQDRPVDGETLKKLVDLARLHASGGNMQPLRYAVIAGQTQKDLLFEKLKWAMYLPALTIAADQRPGGYIVVLCDTRVKKQCQFDLGAAATTIMLAAREMGLDTCALGAFSAQEVAKQLELPDHLHPELVLAVSFRGQESEAVAYDGSICYTMDEAGNFRVPKYSLEDVLLLER